MIGDIIGTVTNVALQIKDINDKDIKEALRALVAGQPKLCPSCLRTHTNKNEANHVQLELFNINLPTRAATALEVCWLVSSRSFSSCSSCCAFNAACKANCRP